MSKRINMTFNITRQDIIEYRGRELRFDQMTGGGHLLLTDLANGDTFQVKDPVTGALGLATTGWFLDMLRERQIVIRRAPLKSAVRQKERTLERELADLRAIDARLDARMSVVRHMDANDVPLSKKKIDKELDVLCTPEWIEKYGPRPSAAAVRVWMVQRGRPGDRRHCDMFSNAGRTERARKLHPTVISIAAYHQLDNFTNQGLSVMDSYKCMEADIYRVNAGKPTSYQETYPQPETPHNVPSYQSFRLGVNKLLSTDTYGAKHGEQARNSRTRGAGQPLRAARFLEKVTADTWEAIGYFCYDAERGLPMGEAHLTAAMDVHSKAVTAWRLECAPPNTATIGELILHQGSGKEISPYYAERYPELSKLCGKPGELIFDNALYQMAKTVEDEGADTGISIRFAGANEPRHKAAHERMHRTLKTYLYNKLPGAPFDIKQMREFGFDPAKHKLATFEELHALTQEAIDFYNTEPHSGLNDRPPLLVAEQSAARHGVDLIADLDKLENVIGDVAFDRVLSKSGVEFWTMRFGGTEEVQALFNDLMGTQRRRTQNPSFKVKVKGDRNNIGTVKVWNPVRKIYVRLINQTVEEAEGMPLWVYQRGKEFARAEGLAFSTREERAFARERLIRLARTIQPEMAARERRTLAKLGRLRHVQEVIGDHISIERVLTSPSGIDNAVPFDLAAPTRIDALVEPKRTARGHAADDDVKRDRRDAGTRNKPKSSAGRDRRDAGVPKPARPPRTGEADWEEYA